MREVLKQDQYAPMPVDEQIAVLLSAAEGVFDPVERDQVAEAEEAVRNALREQMPGIIDTIRRGDPLDEDARTSLLNAARTAVEPFIESHADGES